MKNRIICDNIESEWMFVKGGNCIWNQSNAKLHTKTYTKETILIIENSLKCSEKTLTTTTNQAIYRSIRNAFGKYRHMYYFGAQLILNFMNASKKSMNEQTSESEWVLQMENHYNTQRL